MPLSSPTSLVNAAAASTRRIKLGTTVTVLSTDDPIRALVEIEDRKGDRRRSTPREADVAVAVHGFVAEDEREAKATYLWHETEMFRIGSAEIGRAGRERALERGGMVFVGSPNEIAERILQLHELLRHSRQILQMDVGGMPHSALLKSIELLGTRVLPQIRKEFQPR